ncbi:MAG: DUF3383 family protein [candidate division Zixibacteria bacterium]|nr:DUF3383 family protein [candidate division Zixibacteria bacterium]
MGTEIKDIVVVNITRETAKITRTGFGTPLVFGVHSKFAEDYKQYTSIDGVLEDFLVTDEEYLAALALFSQALSPEKIIIGKRAANVAQIDIVTVDTAQNTTTYTATINGTAFDFLSDADATDLEIADGLVTAINLGAEPVTATDNVDGTFDLDSDVEGDAFTLALSDDGTGSGMSSINSIANVSVATELADLVQLNDDWYFLILSRRITEAEQLQDIAQAAAFVEPRLKAYLYSIDQATMLTSATDDILSVLQALAYERTAGMYSADEDAYPEAAWIGRVAPETPGSVTWKFQQLVGITPDSLNSTEIANLKSKNGNFFETVAGVNIISSEAVVAGGEFIDVIRGSDKLQTRMAERIFTLLVNTDKIPFTNKGIGAIENEVRAELQISVDEGFLEPNSIIVTPPDIDSVPAAEKAVRFLDGLTFSGDLAGAIHKAGIEGTLSL